MPRASPEIPFRSAGSRPQVARVDAPGAMSDDPLPPRCFRCGGPADELNEIEEGRNCPACAERLLATLQGVFHAPWATTGVDFSDEDGEAEQAEVEAPSRSRGGARESSWGPRDDGNRPRPA